MTSELKLELIKRAGLKKIWGLGHGTCAESLQRNKQGSGCSLCRKAKVSMMGAMLEVRGLAHQGLVGHSKATREYPWCNGRPLEALSREATSSGLGF